MNATGKAARKRFGTRFAAKAAKATRAQGRKKGNRKQFGKLPVSNARGNAAQFVTNNSGFVEVTDAPAS